jgi:hypothetical protein
MLLLVAAPMSLSAYDRAQAEADAALLRAYEEENRVFKDLEWHDTATNGQWIAFWTIQVLDVHSTHNGLKYSCIKEGNPLLPEVPSIGRMITHKTVFLAPYWMLQNEGIFTKRDINFANILGAAVVYNNYKLWDKAKGRCTKR